MAQVSRLGTGRCAGLRKRFGDAVFGLHRFFFRIDNIGRFWLSLRTVRRFRISRMKRGTAGAIE